MVKSNDKKPVDKSKFDININSLIDEVEKRRRKVNSDFSIPDTVVSKERPSLKQTDEDKVICVEKKLRDIFS